MKALDENGTQLLIDQTKDWSYHTVELTNAEYQVLVAAGTVDPKVAYYITDAYPEGVGLNHFDRAALYSTTEKVIGQWIDGKPLYQKTIDLGYGPSSATNKLVPHGISDIENVIEMLGFQKNDGSPLEIDPLPRSNPTSTDSIELCIRDTNIRVRTGGGAISNMHMYATIKYTKSTDTAFDAEWSNPEDYSTTEKIIGTWIDGKPLYQKAITGLSIRWEWTNQFLAQSNDISALVAGMETVVSITGFCKSDLGDGQYSHALPIGLYSVSHNKVFQFVTSQTHAGGNPMTSLLIKYTKS